MIGNRFKEFFQLEAASGIVLFVALSVALVIANSPLSGVYQHLIDLPVQLRVGQFNIDKPLILWVNDGLMAIFFMLLALEIKREILQGELSSFSQAILPGVAAIGGIVLPALIYVFFTQHNSTMLKGWPIPIATDIAFVLGIVALLGKRVPTPLKVFLVALSIVDDLLAIAVIALFYTKQLSLSSLLLGLAAFVVLLIMNWRGVKRVAAYMIVGLIMWIFVLKSGVHATLAGILIGFTIPMTTGSKTVPCPLLTLEHNLHPWVAFMILPTFIFLNGGVSFANLSLTSLMQPVQLGIITGLFLGKLVGVLGFTFIFVKLGIGKLPEGSDWIKISGIAALTGIGFTMSMFISGLAFYGTPFHNAAKQGIIFGSLLSGILGIAIFRSQPKAPSALCDDISILDGFDCNDD